MFVSKKQKKTGNLSSWLKIIKKNLKNGLLFFNNILHLQVVYIANSSSFSDISNFVIRNRVRKSEPGLCLSISYYEGKSMTLDQRLPKNLYSWKFGSSLISICGRVGLLKPKDVLLFVKIRTTPFLSRLVKITTTTWLGQLKPILKGKTKLGLLTRSSIVGKCTVALLCSWWKPILTNGPFRAGKLLVGIFIGVLLWTNSICEADK